MVSTASPEDDGQQVVLLGEACADDALGRCRDFGLPEDVLDGDRAVLGDLAGFGELQAATSAAPAVTVRKLRRDNAARTRRA